MNRVLADAVTIHPAALDQIAEIAPLFDMYRMYYGQASSLSGAVDFLTRRMVNFESVIFLARVGDDAAGFAQLYPTFSSVALMKAWILNDLFVHPDHRRKGVGRELLRSAVDHARHDGAKHVMLKTETTNEAAQRLYESEGWSRRDAYTTFGMMLVEPEG